VSINEIALSEAPDWAFFFSTDNLFSNTVMLSSRNIIRTWGGVIR
jgi:hypothetical protein